MKSTLSKMITVVALSLLSSYSSAGDLAEAVLEVQKRWAPLNYSTTNESLTLDQLEDLAEQTDTLVLQHPRNADVLIWNAIVLSTLANKKGGLGALSMVKYAKRRLEKALELDPSALNGSAYASLGTLYHKVPSWPISFGSKKKAKVHFEQALRVNPQGLDTNTLYANFLADSKNKDLAIKHLKIALNSPSLQNRPIADAGRRAEAKALLAKLES